MSEMTTVTVSILDKEYQVSCPPDEVDALTASARFLNQQMDDIRSSGKVVGVDRIAVMAALNIANDYLKNQSLASTSETELDRRIGSLNNKVGNALAQHKQFELR